MNILIIGGNSYIAKNFIKRFQNKYHIISVARSDNKYEHNIICRDYFNIPDDILSSTDIIINCAAIVHHQKKKISPDEYMKINGVLPVHIANRAKQAGVKLFIQLSTMSVYGNDEYIDLSTKENPLTPYGKSKLAADTKLIKLNNDTFKVTILRFPMIYGPGAPGNIASLTKLIRTGLPMPFNDIRNQKTFTYIENLLNYIDVIIEKKTDGLLLLGDMESISTSELVKLISNSINKKILLFKLPNWLYIALKLCIPNTINKLYGSCIVNPTSSIEKLGNFKIFSPVEGISNMIK